MANRFWVAQPVSGAIVSVASPPQVRLTVSSTTGMTTGDVRAVSGVGGTTEANGTWTITVIDATHIDLQGTTFANVYTSGGVVIGKWDATNANNWVSTSGGTNYGQTVPGSSDTTTFDGSSGGGTIIVNATITVVSLAMGAFTGTLDFATNNNNVTLSTVSITGSGARTLSMGNGTWTLTGSNANVWDATTTTNLTFNKNSSTLSFVPTGTPGGTITFAGGSLSYNIVNFGPLSVNMMPFIVAGSNTIATLTVAAPVNLNFTTGTTTTITNAFNWAGTSASHNLITCTGSTAIATIVAGAASVISWAAIRGITFTTSAVAAYNSMNLRSNSGVTIIPPGNSPTFALGM